MRETALFIIKPDGYNKREQIKLDISNHFELLQTYLFEFNPELVARLYPADVDQSHYHALLEYMLESTCELGIVRGDSAIKRFYEIAGESSDPKECAENTLRYKYGKGLDTTKSGLYIVKNAIHRAKSREEFKLEWNLFRRENIIL